MCFFLHRYIEWRLGRVGHYSVPSIQQRPCDDMSHVPKPASMSSTNTIIHEHHSCHVFGLLCQRLSCNKSLVYRHTQILVLHTFFGITLPVYTIRANIRMPGIISTHRRTSSPFLIFYIDYKLFQLYPSTTISQKENCALTRLSKPKTV